MRKARQRRKHNRVQTLLEIHVVDPSDSVDTQCTNLSVDGAFIRTNKRAPTGSFIGLVFKGTGLSEPMMLRARVVRVVPEANDTSVPGMGVEFLDVPPREGARLNTLLEATEAPACPVLLMLAEGPGQQNLEMLLASNGYEVLSASSQDGCLATLEGEHVDALLVDMMLAGEGWKDLIVSVRSRCESMPIILMPLRADPVLAAEAAELRVYDILHRPIDIHQCLGVVRHALQRSHSPGQPGARSARTRPELITNSEPMERLWQVMRRAALALTARSSIHLQDSPLT